jgi:hypothetical protein
LGGRGELYRKAHAPYITAQTIRKAFPMRAETERTIGDIKQALSLLRRHL